MGLSLPAETEFPLLSVKVNIVIGPCGIAKPVTEVNPVRAVAELDE